MNTNLFVYLCANKKGKHRLVSRSIILVAFKVFIDTMKLIRAKAF